MKLNRPRVRRLTKIVPTLTTLATTLALGGAAQARRTTDASPPVPSTTGLKEER